MSSFAAAYGARLPIWVLIGAGLGIVVGLFFGDGAAVLLPFGKMYVRMMEIVVFPYIICSLLHGLGSLTTDKAGRLFRASWWVYLCLYGCVFLILYLLSLAIPAVPPPSYIDATTPHKDLGLMELLIPANPFFDLARNNMPAIVIFSIVYGIAIQRVEKKETFLATLALIRSASVTIWHWIVMVAPLGVFALFAHTAGTLDPAQLADLSLYLIMVGAGTLLLAFWVIPSLIAAVCPLSPRDVISDLRTALLIAVVTSLSVAALPYIQRAAEKLARRMEIQDQSCDEVISTSLAISYPLAQLGNFFIWLFVLFAAFHFHVTIDARDLIALPFVSLLSGIGSPSSSIDAVTFLSTWLGFPDDSTELYVGMMALTRYGQVLASVMGFAFITFLTTLAYCGKLTFRPRRLGLSFIVSAGILALVTSGGRFIQDRFISSDVPTYLSYQLPPSVTEGVSVTFGQEDQGSGTAPKTNPSPDNEPILDRIQRTGVLRVGYNPNIIPFSYQNHRGDVVGFDIAYAFQLARDLNVKLRLIPFDWDNLSRDLEDRRFDLAASGIYVTDKRLRHLGVSAPYFQSPVALIVRSDKVPNFLSRESIAAQPDLKIAIFEDPVMRRLAARLFPDAQVTVLPNYDALDDHPEVDAAVWTLEQAKAWSQSRADFAAVVPKDLGGELLFAYLLHQDAVDLRRFVDYWLHLQRASGFHQRQVDHWIDGLVPKSTKPRWSILRNVLGWDDKNSSAD